MFDSLDALLLFQIISPFGISMLEDNFHQACLYNIGNEIVYWCWVEPLKCVSWSDERSYVKDSNFFFFIFSCKWLGLNIFVLLNVFLNRLFKGMENPYLIQNLFLNGMYIIFQGLQFFLKFLLHAFHFLFQPRQLEFHNFTFFENLDFKTIQLAEIPPDATLIF